MKNFASLRALRVEPKIKARQGNRQKDCLFSFCPKPGGQTEFYNLVMSSSFPRAVDLIGGIGSGKSYAGAWYACMKAKQDPQSRGLISANEYGQLEQSTIIALAEFCDRFGVPLSPVAETPEETARLIASRRLCTIYNAPVLVLSANKFGGTTTRAKQGARGLQIRWAWLDEWAYADKSAWETLNGRLGRGEGSIPGQAVITSSINRNHPFNWVYETFSDPDRREELKKLYVAIRCLTADNDSLDPDYLRSLETSYTPELAALELRGEYVATTEGLIFRYFQRTQHLDGGMAYNPKLPLHLSFDFNHSPACAIASQVYGDTVFILKEWYLLNSDTFELAKAVVKWVKERQPVPTRILVYGDASGSAKTANSKTTNWAIVIKELEGLRWLQQWGSSNPSVTDSIHSCNALFHQNRVFIHPDCKELVKDLESLKFDKNGNIDKSDLMRSHLGDCLRYMLHTLFPLPDAHRQWREGVATWG
ncbi:MAG: hypothetical protein F6J86_07235 [Symploca sp. SIO1B1]|nr:hypothetical protein [Symploca sp. SIO1B1]